MFMSRDSNLALDDLIQTPPDLLTCDLFPYSVITDIDYHSHLQQNGFNISLRSRAIAD